MVEHTGVAPAAALTEISPGNPTLPTRRTSNGNSLAAVACFYDINRRMNRSDHINQLLEDRFDDPYSLLALRLYFGADDWVQDINRDIDDLYEFPERLHGSYRSEWRSVAVRGIHQHGFTCHRQSDCISLQNYGDFLASEVLPQIVHDHNELFCILGQVLTIVESPRIASFKTPLRRQIEALLRL